MIFTHLQNQMLAVLFAAGEPVEADRLADALSCPPEEMEAHLGDLMALLDQLEMPFLLKKLEHRYQLCSRPTYGELIRRTLELGRNAPLSPAALEVLAIVAYNQPVTRAFVEQVRGVDSSGVVTSLAEKGLIEEAGRLDLPGRPIAYRTTPVFLRTFNLEDLTQLPPVDPADRDAPPPTAEEEETQLEFGSLAEPVAAV